MGLKFRIICRVGVPLLICVLLTGLIVPLTLYFNSYGWFSNTVDEMIRKQKDYLCTIAGHVAENCVGALHKPLLYLRLAVALSERYESGDVKTHPGFRPQSSYVSALAFGARYVQEYQRGLVSNLTDYMIENALESIDIPGWQPSVKKSAEMSIWFKGLEAGVSTELNIQEVSQLTQGAVLDAIAHPIIAQEVQTLQMYYGFADGMYYQAPARYFAFSVFPFDYVGAIYKECVQRWYGAAESFPYDPRCRPWYKLTENWERSHLDIVLTAPYKFASRDHFGQTACRGFWNGRFMTKALCIDYGLEPITDYLTNVRIGHKAYSYILDMDYKVFLHPLVNKYDVNRNELPSITSIEFPANDTTDIIEFQAKILPLFRETETVKGKYKKKFLDGDRKTMMIAVSPVFLDLGPDAKNYHQYSIGVVMTEEWLTEDIQDLEDYSERIVLASITVFCCLLLLFILICLYISIKVTQSIVRPVEMLIKAIRQLIKKDYDISIKSYHAPGALETNELFCCLEKIQVLLRFYTDDYFETDCNALMNYARTRKLFKTAGNLRGMEICSVCMARIFARQESYEDATKSFLKAIKLAEYQTQRENPRLSGSWSFIDPRRRMLMNEQELVIRGYKYELVQVLKAQHDKAFQNGLISDSEILLQEIVSLLEHIYMLSVAIESKIDYQFRTQFELCLLYIVHSRVEDARAAVRIMEDLLRDVDSLDTDTPPYILQERLLYCMGCLAQVDGNDREAVELFTQAVMMNEFCSTEIRQLALGKLREIFSAHGLSSPILSQFLTDFENYRKEAVLLVEYSIQMLGERLRRTIESCIWLFDQAFSTDDRLAFLTFNTSCQTVFDLQSQKKNRLFYREAISRCDSPFGGCRLFDAVQHALTQFKGRQRSDEDQYVPWIILVVTGEERGSKTSFEDLYSSLAESGISLIVIGVGIPHSFAPILGELCTATNRSRFFQMETTNELQYTFDTVKDWLNFAAYNTT